MMGVVFNGLEGQTATLSEIVTGDFQDGDEIQVYSTTEGYQIYSYWKDFGGWLDGNFNVASKKFPLGTSFWLKTPNRSVDVTLKGAVLTGEYRHECVAGFQMITVGLPREFDLNKDLKWEGLTDGDEIQIREGDTYVIYTYWKDFGGWLDGGFLPASRPISVGSSIWLRATNAGVTVTTKAVTK